MDKYKDIVDKYKINENVFKNALVSFISGGVLGVLAEIMVNFYSNYYQLELSLSLMSITFIFIASILTGFDIFDDLKDNIKQNEEIQSAYCNNYLHNSRLGVQQRGKV